MIEAKLVAICGLALAWGLAYAVWLQVTKVGAWFARCRTWLATAIGVGVDLILVLFLVNWEDWAKAAGVFGLSAIGIVGRSLYNEWRDGQEVLLEQARRGNGDAGKGQDAR